MTVISQTTYASGTSHQMTILIGREPRAPLDHLQQGQPMTTLLAQVENMSTNNVTGCFKKDFKKKSVFIVMFVGQT